MNHDSNGTAEGGPGEDDLDDILDRDLAPQARHAAEPPPVYLIDASIYVFRAWHTMPDEFRDTDGWPTNAVHGFARFLLDVLERERPKHIAVAFDEALDSCFRNRLYPAYKANRDPAPDELKRQFAVITITRPTISSAARCGTRVAPGIAASSCPPTRICRSCCTSATNSGITPAISAGACTA
jgi:hypothetical protein